MFAKTMHILEPAGKGVVGMSTNSTQTLNVLLQRRAGSDALLVQQWSFWVKDATISLAVASTNSATFAVPSGGPAPVNNGKLLIYKHVCVKRSRTHITNSLSLNTT
ncbi:hypothetical protein KCU74_g14953, partial [Aureobasidium melanogenum]